MAGQGETHGSNLRIQNAAELEQLLRRAGAHGRWRRALRRTFRWVALLGALPLATLWAGVAGLVLLARSPTLGELLLRVPELWRLHRGASLMAL
eukprot:SAG11_NODE_11060_length_786_cov_1.071325_1_plen_93_part_10